MKCETGRGRGILSMDNHITLRRQFLEVSLEIKGFIEKCELIYLAESHEVIDGGAYNWAELSEENKKIQKDLCARYKSLIDAVDIAEFEDHVSKRFICSWERVLDFLEHESIILQDTTDKVCEDIKAELKLQLWLSKTQ